MSKIHVLPPHEALKIAAGEVVERPAHIVKELVENALDAGATQITLYAQQAGKKLLRIVDNGCGMAADDAHLCFLPHATSKIKNIHDLEQIASFGFRGEALASVAAISKVMLVTRSGETADDDLGILLEYSEGNVLREELRACPVGTDITVQDLFFNTPVRKKFLKQDETEWNAIQAVMYAFAISNPRVYFKLLHDDKLVLNAPPVKNAKDRASQLWEYNFAQSLIALSDDSALNGSTQSPAFSISGYISNHQVWRYGRQNIYFFVNKRWVKNHELSKALMKGYMNVLPSDRFPAALIFIEIDQQFLDVNIHPKKEEIKFSKPGVIQTTLATLVKATLEKQVTKQVTKTVAPVSLPMHEVHQTIKPAIKPDRFDSGTLEALFNFSSVKPEVIHNNITGFPAQQAPEPEFVAQRPIINRQESDNYKIVGQLFNTYIILEKEEETVFIDQHAAHERILYEKFQKNFSSQEGTALLFPEIIALTPVLVAGVMAQKKFFDDQGIDVDIMGIHELVVRSAPPFLKGACLKDFINQAALFIEEHDSMEPALFSKTFNEHLHGQMACKGAVKAGDVLTVDQIKKLIDDLQHTEKRFICVHGRPTTWTVAKSELEKKFRR